MKKWTLGRASNRDSSEPSLPHEPVIFKDSDFSEPLWDRGYIRLGQPHRLEGLGPHKNYSPCILSPPSPSLFFLFSLSSLPPSVPSFFLPPLYLFHSLYFPSFWDTSLIYLKLAWLSLRSQYWPKTSYSSASVASTGHTGSDITLGFLDNRNPFESTWIVLNFIFSVIFPLRPVIALFKISRIFCKILRLNVVRK